MSGFVRDGLYRVFDRWWRGYEDFLERRRKRELAACGERVHLSPRCSLWSLDRLSLGDDVEINPFTHIFAGGGVSIGAGTLISSNCAISSVTHVKNSRARHALLPEDAPPSARLLRPVTIGRNVWVGAGALILPGVTIGDDAIVGAGAVVTKDVPAGCVVVGNPARPRELLTFPDSP